MFTDVYIHVCLYIYCLVIYVNVSLCCAHVNWCRTLNITHFVQMHCVVVYVSDPIQWWSPLNEFCVIIAPCVMWLQVCFGEAGPFLLYICRTLCEGTTCKCIHKKSILPEVVVSSVLSGENESKLSETLYLVPPPSEMRTPRINRTACACVHQQSTKTILYNVHVL